MVSTPAQAAARVQQVRARVQVPAQVPAQAQAPHRPRQAAT